MGAIARHEPPGGEPLLQGRPTAEVIADHLREQIVLGVFRPGQQINESVLAAQLTTSRGPLREALQRLCQEGFLINWRNHGVYVLELTKEDVKEIYAVREAIELSSASTLPDGEQENIDDTIRVLKQIVGEMAKHVALPDWQALARLDMQFHTTFVAASGNSRLIRIHQTVAAESRMCILNLDVSYPRGDVLVREHQMIIDRLDERDRRGLQEAITQHMRKAVEDLTPGRAPQVRT
ncbi:uncharacterized HTH-type transcriptional regulator YdhC (plasmid) [Arthrobacter sp. Hiyo8]|uniref:GntR family transcriptional regulator n=1 Tax=Arthrobacter sp. Hiyo1 TaxID=1588020 RepID=UPI000683AF92|nr:GntR family transcriptional regulator [Arthrobacter sp. Hiyo1]BAS18483.1 uncharacterized HTH-type transcriptional regulator YdhC [Arthrobacter sp. Hiyo8]GAP60772.1 uncharacterized HTH-type transcriptional regulator YdhC [Arthrobacter sp. Hiyo1]